MKNTRTLAILALPILLNIAAQSIKTGETQRPVIEIRFAQKRFIPTKVEVPAGVPLAVRVVNASKERIEFESLKLNRERVVDPGETITVNLLPLKPGSYDFYDDFNDDVPEGRIVAK